MMYNKTLCFFIVLMFLLTGCYKDVIVIEDLRNTIGDTTQTSSSSKTNIVNIAPVVGGYTSSGASSVTEFQAGGIVQAFVFISGLQFLESPCFKSLKAGTLTPVSNPLGTILVHRQPATTRQSD